jgi:hypothetical protein
MRNDRYKLAHFYYNLDVWEFYDLEKDPEEMHNAINDPEYADIITKMKDELKQLMTKYDDAGSLDDYRKITDTDFGAIN